MDKLLISKILGKKDSVDLDDAIHNLKEITENLRNLIILNIDLDEDFIKKNKIKLINIHKTIRNIKARLSNIDTLQGYTNSRKFLQKYIGNIETDINGVVEALDVKDRRTLTYHSNMLIDLLLVY